MSFAKLNKYNKSGQTVWSIVFDDWTVNGHGETIRGIAVDGSNNVYTLSYAWGVDIGEAEDFTRIHKISSSGGIIWNKLIARRTYWPSVPDTPQWPIAVSQNGFCIAVTDQCELISGEGDDYGAIVTAFSSSGEALWEIAPLNYPQKITIEDDGFIYVIDLDGMYKINALGETIWTNTDVKANWA